MEKYNEYDDVHDNMMREQYAEGMADLKERLLASGVTEDDLDEAIDAHFNRECPF